MLKHRNTENYKTGTHAISLRYSYSFWYAGISYGQGFKNKLKQQVTQSKTPHYIESMYPRTRTGMLKC
jgi:hypothetical protein